MIGQEPNEFEVTYRRHVGYVVSGDVASIMADMAPGAVPDVFAGVNVPRGEVSDATIRTVGVQGDRAVGECVYTTADGQIGLRSGWGFDGSAWKADVLENFVP